MSEYSLELVAEQEQETMLEVVKLQSEGRTPTYIRNQTGLSNKEQKDIAVKFKNFVNNDRYIQERARESVGQIDQHYTSLLAKFYETYDDALANEDYKTQADILTRIANIEKARVDFLGKAGMLSAGGIGEDLAELEEQKERIKTVLKEIAHEKPEVAKLISQKLSKMDGTIIAERVAGDIE